MKRALLLAILALGGSLGCGYKSGLTAPEGAKTIGLEFFGNDGPLRDLEVQLQDELAQAVQRLLDAPLVDPSRADLVIRGRVVNYSRRSGIRSPGNKLLETGVRVTVEAFLIDPAIRLARDGTPLPPRILRRARTTTESGYRLEEPDGERAARERALRNIADRLALDLFGPVAYEPGQDEAESEDSGSILGTNRVPAQTEEPGSN